MPSPPTLRPDPLAPQFRYNDRAARYIDNRGRFVARQAVRGELENVVTATSKAMREVSEQLRSGAISLADWQAQMMQEIKTTHLAGAAMERGGWAQMTQADFGRVGAKVRQEYAHLQKFAEQIASGKQKLDGTLSRRAQLYSQASRETFHQFAGQGMAKRGFDQERNVLNPADHCQGPGSCTGESDRGWVGIGELIPIGSRLCRSGCQCSIEYRNSQNPDVTEVI